jgi:hypothetical protein
MFTLYHTNAIDTAILAGGAWQPQLPLSNLYSPQPTRRARSVNAALTSTQFTVALTEAVVVRGIQVISTNMSAAGRYKMTWYADAGMTTENGSTGFVPVGTSIDWADISEWYDWLHPDFWLGALPFIDPDNHGRDIRHTFAQPTTVQYLKFEFDDVTNAKGYFEAGYLYIGHAFVPSINVDSTPTFSRVSLTSVVQAVGGSQFYNRRGSRKRLVVTWSVLPQTEVLVDIDEIVRIQDIDKAVYVDLEPENASSGGTTSFLGRIERLPESRLLSAYIAGDTAATIGFEFAQVL